MKRPFIEIFMGIRNKFWIIGIFGDKIRISSGNAEACMNVNQSMKHVHFYVPNILGFIS